MNETICTMLMLSRLEAGKIVPESLEVSLQQIIETVIDEQKNSTQATQKIVHKNANKKQVIQTDERLLKEVINSLLNNAIKYTKRNGKIIVSVEYDSENAIIHIQDNGAGIPQREKKKVFTKFFRASNIADKKTVGSGLALYLDYSLVDKLHG